ncbi:MAG: beta-ketoacyl-[acyl-carrier-protein] synthase family protein [Planctomycetota bacterium]
MSDTDSSRIVITGMGAISPAGNSVAAFWESLSQGRDCLAPITRFDASPFRNGLAGEVREFALPDPEASRANAFALAAMEQAIADADLDGEALADGGLALATNFGGCDHGERFFAARLEGEDPDPRWLRQYDFAAALRQAIERWGFRGPAAGLSLSCASGVGAIGLAMDWIRAGRCVRAVAGGYDELSRMSYSGLSAMRAITSEVIRPFDKNRKGTLFAEGAGAVVVETLDAARERGAAVHAEVLGHAMNNDAFHMTAPDTSGTGITAVIRTALADGGVRPEDVDHVNAHGTGTQYNDKIETAAIKAVLGDRARQVTVTANKSMIGHTCGAAGTLESICTVRTLQTGLIPPTIRYETPDPECDLDYVPNEPRQGDVRTALCNAYGIGGTNAAIVLRRWEGE